MHTFYGQFDEPVDKFIYERYFFDDNRPGIFVECGAFDGETECSCRFFEESLAWTGYNLEPVPWIFERLVANRPSSQNRNFGLSDQTSSLDFKSVVHPELGPYTTLGSLSHSDVAKNYLHDTGCAIEIINVPVLTWHDFVYQENLNIIDLLVLDVEGHELNVLSVLTESNVKPYVLCVEYGHIGLGGLRRMLEPAGYKLDTISYANAFFIHESYFALLNFKKLSQVGRSVNMLENRTYQGSDSR